ncbi:MAG: two-component system LytT family response regulator [Saprospiraceae bacterium]|jgi:two-component system LytT family response regulator|tara:strand:- start:806 stop:1195 length:390 start_codon:yes stop_codon:yes gene_type:complete
MKIIKPDLRISKSKLEALRPSKEKICIKTESGNHIILKRDISHLIADCNYTTIYYKDQKVLCSQTIGSVLLKLNHPRFIRIHKSHAINIDCVCLIDNAYSYTMLDNGIRLSIARTKKQKIKEAMHQRFD